MRSPTPSRVQTPVSPGGQTHAAPGRWKPNTLGLVDVVFMAVATSAPITAMSGNVPFSVGYGVGWGTPATYIFATVILSIFAVGYVAMARYVTSTGAFYGFISRGLGRVTGLGAHKKHGSPHIASFAQAGIATLWIRASGTSRRIPTWTSSCCWPFLGLSRC